jgi:GH15 family glucan-1,4-alpha-glucosidase
MTQRHTYRMGIVGNCAYMAHVDASARVVWLCWPRFDSSFVFGHLLDPERGGELAVRSTSDVSGEKQEYVWNTNVLQTTIETGLGTYRVTDCAPRFVQFGRLFKPLMLIRKLEPISGAPRIAIASRPRRRYGTESPRVFVQSNHLRYDFGEETVRLNTNVPLSYVMCERPFVLNEVKYLVITWGVPFEALLEETAEEYLRRTIVHWQQWVQHCAIGRFYQRHVIRSALALKLHQYEDTGAIIAAGTTSLPEFPRSGRNWDYRYCWLRDAYFTLAALNRIGQFEEMQSFAEFIENIAASVGHGRYPAVVRIDGARELPERTVSLRGYDDHGMVRVGNAAYAQVQNDIYGQVIYALLQLYVDARFPREPRETSKRLMTALLSSIETCLHEPDASLWEFRDLKQRHCYTTLCHWIGAKAAAKIARVLGDREMLRAATRLVVRSARLLEACYDPDVGAYMQEPGSRYVDASALHLVIVHYLDPGSDRATRHIAALKEQLMTPQGLMHRYTHADDFGEPSAAFLACSFWYVEALAVMGRIEEALGEFERLLCHANHLGLFSEHVDPVTGSQWGNFPQTYSHVGLMNAVMRITSKIDYPEFY